MKRIFAPLVTGAALLIAAPSLAVTTIAVTLDLNNATITTTPASGPYPAITTLQQAIKLATPVAIAEGDVVNLNVSFAPGQSITASGELTIADFITAVLGSPATNVTSTGSLTLVGSGTVGHPADYVLTKTDTEGTDHVGQVYTYSDGTFNSLPAYPGSVTFTGLDWAGTITDYSAAGLTTRNYDTPNIIVKALSETVSGVPEPTTWAMMLTGFGLVGFALRKRASSSSITSAL